jgi:hypothetical protein
LCRYALNLLVKQAKEAERELEEEERKIRPAGVAALDQIRTPDALEKLKAKHAGLSKAILELVREVHAVEKAYEDCKSTVGLYKLSPVVIHSSKAPGFNPCTSKVISWFPDFAFSNAACTATPRCTT